MVRGADAEAGPSITHGGLSAGTLIGSYRIDNVFARGGAGVVYRATDTKLQRPVAVKFLSDDLADPAARRRFQREAQMASSLNHPHILTVHDVGEYAGRNYIVTEWVDGGTLHEWAAERHAWRKVVELLSGVADALAAAHAANILHRDVKPANILLSRSGYAKLADFGLAKLAVDTEADPAARALGHTATGVIVGTIAYMSPEQAAGKPLDERTDIFSFGVVLYEMLAGAPPFAGETAIELLRKVMDGTVPPLDGDLPEALRLIVEKALAREPEERYQSMREMVVDLRRLLRRTTSAAPAVADAHTRWRFAWYAVPLVIVGVIGAAMLRPVRQTPAPIGVREIRFEVATPASTDTASLALSPDGQTLVFEATSDEQSRLWLHSLASLSRRPLPGTESASFPFWSPDSRSIGFFADGKLKRVDLDDGLVRTLADASIGRGGTWGPDGTIVFSPGTNHPLLSVSALGGKPKPLTRLGATQAGHRFPQFLPDGRHLLYYATGSPESRGEMVAAVDGSDARRLFEADTAATFGAANQLFFSNRGALYAQGFDPARRELVGTAVTMREQAATDAEVYRLALTASSVGSIAYRVASVVGQRQFTWFDRAGAVVGHAGDPLSGLSPAMSPDGRYVAFSRVVNGNQDVWLLDVASGDVTRFTFDPGIDYVPLWSPDGTRILFSSNRSGVFDLYEKSATGAGAETLVLATPQTKFAVDWSSDGKFVLYESNDPEMNYDIWALPMGEERTPFPVVRTGSEEQDAQFSPDGRWIAYQSNDSGRLEVYVKPFRGAATRWQVSRDGGAEARWRGDGKELFYLALDGELMSVPLRFDSSGSAIEAGAPVRLFATRMGRGVQTSNRQQYVVSDNGQRFLMNSILEDATRSPINVVLNWRNER